MRLATDDRFESGRLGFPVPETFTLSIRRRSIHRRRTGLVAGKAGPRASLITGVFVLGTLLLNSTAQHHALHQQAVQLVRATCEEAQHQRARIGHTRSSWWSKELCLPFI